MADQLVVWLYGAPIGRLSRLDNLRIAMSWDKEGIARWGRGSRILSTSLPVGERLSSRDDRALDFFENLLPDGPARQAMARFAHVSPYDTFGILTEWGRECAGAVILTPDDEAPPREDDGSYDDLTDDELHRALESLDRLPFGAATAASFKPSLAGFQRKLLVGRSNQGRWQRPVGGAPSTWILKPDGHVPVAANEVACVALARRVELAAPRCELIHVDGTPTLAIERYDRNGTTRIHQEDGCQATGSPAGLKYEQEGGPSVRAFARVLRDYGAAGDLTELLRRITFNVTIGNADAHAKNFSILHPVDDRGVELAPVYDVIATTSLHPVDQQGRRIPNDPTMGQLVDGVSDIRRVTRINLVREGTSWGLTRTRAADAVDDVVERILSDHETPEWLARVVARRASSLAATTRPAAKRSDNRSAAAPESRASSSVCGATTTKGTPCRRVGHCPYHAT